MNPETHYALNDIHLPHNTIDQYYFQDIFSNIDVEATNLAKTWYNDSNFYDLVSYDGISLVEITEFDFMNLFAFTIECINSIEAAILKEKPQKIIVFDDWDKNIVGIAPKRWESVPINVIIAVGGKLNVVVERIRVPPLSTKGGYSLLGNLKKKGLSKTFMWCCNFISRIQQKAWPHKKNILYSHKYSVINRILGGISDIRLISFDFTPDLVQKTIVDVFSGRFSYWPPYNAFSQKTPESRQYIEKVTLKWKMLLQSHPAIKYKQYNLWDILKDVFTFAFFDYFPLLISRYNFTKKRLIIANINLIIVSGIQVDYQRLLLLAANDTHIPTILIHHGVVFETLGFLSLSHLTEVEAWGQNEQDLLMRLSNENDRRVSIQITGSPVFDEYVHSETKGDPRQRLCQKLNLDPAKKIVVLALHHCERWITIANMMLVGMEWYSFFEMVIRSVEKHTNCQLIIKLHPSDEESNIHKRMISEISRTPIPVIQNEESIYNIIQGCDIWISYPSTTILDAMVMKKPVITIIPEGKEFKNSSVLKAGIVVRKKEDLEGALNQILENSELVQQSIARYPEYIHHHVYRIDGKSSTRIRDRILQILDNNRRWP